MKKILCLIVSMLILFSCSENPKDRLLSPIHEMETTAKDINELVIYDDELKCGGVMLYTWGDNQQLDFNYRDTNQNKCIRYYWNGGKVKYKEKEVEQETYNWCGFGLIVGKDWTQIDKIHNLSPYGFKKLKFKLRGGYLSSNVKFKIVGAKNSSENDVDVLSVSGTELTSNWKDYEITLTNNLDDINIYIGFIFENQSDSQSKGGEIFIDEIKFVK